MNNYQLLDTSYAENIKIKLTNQAKQEAWGQISHINNNFTRHRSYLNLLVRNAFISWLSLMLEEKTTDNLKLKNYFSIWEFINGNAIEINSSRIVLIPTETEDKTEISIPQEWLTIPDWVGNYYVVAEVNLTEDYLSFWGYTSYETLLNHSQLDVVDSHRDLAIEYLENDLNLIALEYEYGWEEIPQIEPIHQISAVEKNNLLAQIKEHLFPRYLLNFSQWLNIISDEQIRNQLYDSRQPIKLSQWLTQQINSTITQGWQNGQDLVNQLLATNLSLQPSFSTRRQSLSLIQALQVIQENRDFEAVNQVLSIIPSLAIDETSTQTIIETLTNLIVTSDNEEIRWDAALALEKLSADHSLAPCWYSKTINLVADSPIAGVDLLMGILAKSETQVSIFVRICQPQKDKFLPNNLKLQIIDEEDNVYQEIVSSEYDNIIQYKFWGNKEEKFALKLLIDDVVYTQENFII